MGRTRLTEHLWFIYGPLEGRTVHFTDRKQDLRPTWSTVWEAAQRAPREGSPMYFPLCFIVLLKQLRRLYISGLIFQVPPVCYGTALTRTVSYCFLLLAGPPLAPWRLPLLFVYNTPFYLLLLLIP